MRSRQPGRAWELMCACAGTQLQTKQLNGVVHEQRVLNQQLIGRNDELGQLYQRLKLQQSFLRKARSG